MCEIELAGLGFWINIVLVVLGILFICDKITDVIVYWILKCWRRG